jgi:hypothetical protein
LIRLKQLACTQPEPFAEIEIVRTQPGESSVAPAITEGTEPAPQPTAAVAVAPDLARVTPEPAEPPTPE